MSGMISSNPLPAPRSALEWFVLAATTVATWWFSNTIIIAAKFGNWLGESGILIAVAKFGKWTKETGTRTKKWLGETGILIAAVTARPRNWLGNIVARFGKRAREAGTRTKKWLLGHPWLVALIVVTGVLLLLGHIEWLREEKAANWQWYPRVLVGPALLWLVWLVAKLRGWRLHRPQLRIPRWFIVGAKFTIVAYIICQAIYWSVFILADAKYWPKIDRLFWPVMLGPIVVWFAVAAQRRWNWIGKVARYGWQRRVGMIKLMLFAAIEILVLRFVSTRTTEWSNWLKTPAMIVGGVLGAMVASIIVSAINGPNPITQKLCEQELLSTEIKVPIRRLWGIFDPRCRWILFPWIKVTWMVGSEANQAGNTTDVARPIDRIVVRRDFVGIGQKNFSCKFESQAQSVGDVPGILGFLFRVTLLEIVDATWGENDSTCIIPIVHRGIHFIDEITGRKYTGNNALQQIWWHLIDEANTRSQRKNTVLSAVDRQRYLGR